MYYCGVTQLIGYTYKIEGRISYGRRILSFIFLTLSGFLIVYGFAVPFIVEEYDPKTYSPIAGIILATVPFFAGFVIGIKTDILVNTERKHITIRKSVSGVVFKKTILRYEQLEYVSVFRNYTGYHEAKLFYNGRENVHLFEIRKELQAVSKVERISDALSIPVHNLILVEYWKDKKAPYVSPGEREISAYLSEGRRSFWQNTLVLLLSIIVISGIYSFINLLVKNDFELEKGMRLIGFIVILLGGLSATLFLVRNYLFDFKNGHYKMIYKIGPLEFGQWKLIRRYDYVSIQKNNQGMFRIHFGCNKTKHFRLGMYGSYEEALQVATRLALKFNVDLWDETSPS